jgi:hypothetical protein
MRQSVVIFLVSVATIPASAQLPNHSTRSGKVPTSAPLRTPDGHPDLQGVWTNDTSTPLERPKQFAGKAFFEASEQAVFQAAVRHDNTARIGEENLKTSGDLNFLEHAPQLLPDRRTALIVDPRDGTLPALLPAAQLRVDQSLERKRQHIADGPEDFDIAERCIAFPSPPMLPLPADAFLRIVQTQNYVVIHTEILGEARIVPLDGRPHLPSEMRAWKGDSHGRWEKVTLVVETANFRPQRTFNNIDQMKGTDASLRVIERFTLIDADTILYRFTIDDPTVYASAWTAEAPFSRTSKPMFEFACHEGNYSLKNSLTGARAVERKTAADPQ